MFFSDDRGEGETIQSACDEGVSDSLRWGFLYLVTVQTSMYCFH